MKIINAIVNCVLLSLCGLCAIYSEADELSEEYFLVGSYTKASSEGVYRLKLDHDKQRLENIGLVAKAINPSFLAFDENPESIFAVTSDKHGGISHFVWNEQAQQFNLNTLIEELGQGACHIAISPDNSQLAIANYTSGEVYRVSRDTQTNKLTLNGRFQNKGKGITSRQESPHMHYVQWDKSGKYLYAVDLGTDEIKYFDNNDTSFKALIAAKLQPGDGPRHLVFHPTLPRVYVVNELSNTIVAFEHNEVSGKLTKIGRYPTTPNNNEGLPSAIRISKDGNFLYTAIRGETSNHISVFSISSEGQLTYIQHHPAGGNFPRDINFSSQQNYLLVANQYDDSITVLARNTKTGLLSSTNMKVEISTPSFIASHAFLRAK